MKHLKTIFFGLLLVATASFFSACEESEDGDNANNPAAYSRVKTYIVYNEQEQEALRIEYNSYDAQGHIIKRNAYKLIENYGFTIYGSTSSYDSKGREIESKSYYPTPNGNGELCGRTEYSYPSDNLVEIKSYEIHNSVENLEYSLKYSINGRTLTTESYNGDGLISNKLVLVFRSSISLDDYLLNGQGVNIASIIGNSLTMDGFLNELCLYESREETRYDDDGNVESVNRIENEYTYDSQGRITGVKSGNEADGSLSIDYAANTVTGYTSDGLPVYIHQYNSDGLLVLEKIDIGGDDQLHYIQEYEYGNKELTVYGITESGSRMKLMKFIFY